MTNGLEASYDEVPYPGSPHPQTHPDRLAMLAHLHGLTPPHPKRCRVLELGCADGSNLIPMAEAAEDAEFVGVDFSEKQIATARGVIDRLGLTNVSVLRHDIADIDASFGEFDFVIAHGVFSWVPEAIRSKVLEILQTRMAANGVGYLSFNTQPGWQTLGAIRRLLMRQQVSKASGLARITSARKALRQLGFAASSLSTPHTEVLRETIDELQDLNDGLLLHDELEVENRAFFFHEFVDQLEAHGLGYVTDSDLHSDIGPEFEAFLPEWESLGSRRWLEAEQWYDMVHHRRFRQSLVCHADRVVDRRRDATRLFELHFASSVVETDCGSSAIRSGKPREFRHVDGRTIELADEFSAAALSRVAEAWPSSVSFLELADRLTEQVGGSADDGWKTALAERLLVLARKDLLELRYDSMPVAAEVPAKPRTSRYARMQAVGGDVVTNLLHRSIGLDRFHASVLRLLDGHATPKELIHRVADEIADGRLVLEEVSPADRESLEQTLATILPDCLRRFARAALLRDRV